MIIQLGALFSTALSGLGRGLSQVIQAVAPAALNIGQQFLQREINRKLQTTNRRQVQARAVEVLNTPGITNVRLGGTIQPVGGRVQRSTFQPAALTTAQSPIGNIPLLPVGLSAFSRLGGRGTFGLGFPAVPFGGKLHTPERFRLMPDTATNGRGVFVGPRQLGIPGEPRFAQDEHGKTIMFVPLPDGNGFVPVSQARALNLNPTRPFWRFNRITSRYEKIKPRRLNPFNFRATARAGRRVCRTLDAVKELVHIERRQSTGKIRLKKVKKRKKC